MIGRRDRVSYRLAPLIGPISRRFTSDSMTSHVSTTNSLAQSRVAFVGKLAGMTQREATKRLRQYGAVVVDAMDAADLIVVGEDDLPLRYETGQRVLRDLLDAPSREKAEAGRLQVITETQLWQRLGVVEDDRDVRRLYTAGMLAGFLDVPIAIVRRWRRRGLIQPVYEVRRLEYYDFQEVAAARRLAELLAAGVPPKRIENQLADLRRILPGVERPLAQLSVIVEGKDILLRQGDGLIDAGGQMRFDFDVAEKQSISLRMSTPKSVVPFTQVVSEDPASATPDDLLQWAAQLEDEERLEEAEEAYRAALSAGGPKPEVCFQLADVLYRQGELPAARERYYMAVELDEEYVEARANLGCVLRELGQKELAIAAFEGALKHHGDYPDAHFHLARLLFEASRFDEADPHWQAFLQLSPDSPWAEEARRRLDRV